MPDNVTEMKPGTHAHYCVFCASQGVETIWAHGNEQAGNLSEHRCPRCGHVEWVKMQIASGKLPQEQRQEQTALLQVVSIQETLLYAFACVLLAWTTYYLVNWAMKTFGKKVE